MAKPAIRDIDKGTEDIMEDWGDTCAKWFRMVEQLKVPGRKAKCKYLEILNALEVHLLTPGFLMYSIRVAHIEDDVLQESGNPRDRRQAVSIPELLDQ